MSLREHRSGPKGVQVSTVFLRGGDSLATADSPSPTCSCRQGVHTLAGSRTAQVPPKCPSTFPSSFPASDRHPGAPGWEGLYTKDNILILAEPISQPVFPQGLEQHRFPKTCSAQPVQAFLWVIGELWPHPTHPAPPAPRTSLSPEWVPLSRAKPACSH